MKFKNKPARIAGSIILPVVYITLLLIKHDPDFIVHALGPFGFPVWLVQWIAFLIGGGVLATLATVVFSSILGFLLGWFIDLIIVKIRNSKSA